jgi:fermentation-respiration switch protein FrsA (DUF1100 family)
MTSRSRRTPAALLRVAWCACACLASVASATPPGGPEGWWIGVAKGNRDVDVVLRLARADGVLRGDVAIPALGVLGSDIADLREDAGRLTGSVPAMSGSVRIDLRAASGALDGTLLATPPGLPEPLEWPVRFERTADARAVAGARRYGGAVAAGPQQLVMGVWIAADPAVGWCACLDIPAQDVEALPLRVRRADDGVITARIPVPGEAVFVLREDGGALRGTFSQGALRAEVAFGRLDASAPLPEPGAAMRPQDPRPPLPYSVRDVEIRHPSGHLMAGTLVLPAGASRDSRVPAVVFVTGSGPQDRDESMMGHRPFLVIADSLARRGIASLRCDDRGVGGSTGDFGSATTFDFASDARVQLEWLAAVPEVDAGRTGFIGHSEGGIVGPMAAASIESDAAAAVRPAFVVILAGPGVDGAAILKEQNTAMFRAAGIAGERLERVSSSHAAMVDSAVSGAGEEELRTKVAAAVDAQLDASGQAAAVDAERRRVLVDGVVAQMRAPWMVRFLALDPRASLRALRCPVLALFGERDLQVLPAQNEEPVASALREAGVPATVRVMPGLNHLFQPAKTGGLDEYASIDTTVDPAVLEAVGDWVLAQPPRPPASR